MTPKEWLMRGQGADEEIRRLRTAKKETWERITSGTQKTGKNGRSEQDPHRFERYAAFDNEIELQIERMLEIQTEIIQVIGEIRDPRLRHVLEERFIRWNTLERTAVNLHYSYAQTCRLQGEAFKEVEKIINKHATK